MDGPGRTFTHHGQWPINGTGPPGTPTLNMDIFPPPAAPNLRLSCPELIVASVFIYNTKYFPSPCLPGLLYIDTASSLLFKPCIFLFFPEHIQFGPSRRVSISLDIFRACLRRGVWREAGAGLSKNTPASRGSEGDEFPHFGRHLWPR